MIINELPPEILSKIFLSAYDDDCTFPIGKRRYVRTLNRKRVPLSLIHVCKYWRETALSLHSLWTHLCGDYATPAATEQWLKFSDPALVHLTLNPPMYNTEASESPTVARVKQMLQLFARHSDRWGSLNFNTLHPEIAQEFADIIRDNASSSPIRSLGINLPRKATTSSIIDSLISSIPLFSSLHELTWIVPSGMPRIFPWSTLHDVYLMANFQIDDAIWCLAQCVSATAITLAGNTLPGQGRSPTLKHDHSTLPNLKSLTLTNDCNPWEMLQYFTLPSLSTLELFTLQVHPPLLEEFLTRWQCPLIVLRLGIRWNSGVTNANVVQCLLLPCLQAVDVVEVSVRDAFKQFPEILEQWPDIMLKLPRLKAVGSSHIGWVSRSSMS